LYPNPSSFSCFANPENCAFLCFGNLDRSDDAIGLLIGRKLKDQYPHNVYSEELDDPIDYLLDILKNPEIRCVIVIDASNFGARPGSILVTSNVSDAKTRLTTHSIPIEHLKNMIEEAKKIFIFIGIQVKNVEFMGKVSDEVQQSVDEVIKLFKFP